MKRKILTGEMVSRFSEHLCREEKSAATQEKYLRDVLAFCAYADDNEITKELVVAWKKRLVEQGYAVRSINSMLASVNSLLDYLGLSLCKVKNIRMQHQTFCTEEKELTKAEYLRLLTASKKNEQLNLVIQTICGTGIRVSELRCFTVDAVKHGEVTVDCKNKTRRVFVPSKLQNILLNYSKRHGITAGAIFVTRTGKPLNRSNIWAAMKKLCEVAGVKPSKVFPHNLRKLFARTFYGIEKDIAGFRFWVAYDMDALTLVSVEKGEVLIKGDLKSNVDDEDATITWFSVSNVTGDGELMTLTFNISASAGGSYPLTVTYDPEDILNAGWQKVDCTVTDGLIKTGSRIEGSITSFGDADGEVSVKLLSGSTEVTATTTTNGTYYLDSIAPGTYTLQVSKLNHATRTHEITVTDENITQDVKIHLLGDINGDGRLNIGDVNKANAHAAKTKLLTDYEFICADTNGDGRVNIGDVNKMNAHAAKTKLLW